MSNGPTISVFHPIILAAFGAILSVGIVYGTFGAAIKANATAIEGLTETIEVVNDLVTAQAVSNQIQEDQALDIARILRILEDRPKK